jgi:hypothetical protein
MLNHYSIKDISHPPLKDEKSVRDFMRQNRLWAAEVTVNIFSNNTLIGVQNKVIEVYNKKKKSCG